MAEMGISIFDCRYWNRRLGDRRTLQHQTQALEDKRNVAGAIVHWRFTAADARVRLQGLYPSNAAC